MADETPKKASGRATITPDDTVKFLIACIKFVNQGKIDWKAVATECDIVSAGAAAKRYTRLLKANGVDKNKMGDGADDGDEDANAAAVTPKSKTVSAKAFAGGNPKKAPASKKRKVADADNEGLESRLEHKDSVFGNVATVKSEDN